MIPAFVAATGATWLLAMIAEACGCHRVEDRNVVLEEIGRKEAAKKDLDEQISKLHRKVKKP